MKKAITLLSVLVMCMAFCFANGSGEESKNNSTPQVAVMFGTGGLGDQNMNDNVNAALKNAQKSIDFTYDYVEPKAVSEFESFLREFCQANEYVLVITVGSDGADATTRVAKEYPNQKFMILDADSIANNVLGVRFKDNESTFLGGYVASLFSETGTIGVIGGMDNVVINGFIAGWEAGAKIANPEINLLRSYCGSFKDPVKAKEMALQMYQNGADVVFGAAGGSGLGIFQAAEETGKYAVGVDTNQNPIKPDCIILSCVRSFNEIISSSIRGAIDGSIKVGTTIEAGIAEDAVDCVFEGSNVVVDESIKASVQTLKLDVKAGKIQIPNSL